MRLLVRLLWIEMFVCGGQWVIAAPAGVRRGSSTLWLFYQMQP
jgi:hypothetical protein